MLHGRTAHPQHVWEPVTDRVWCTLKVLKLETIRKKRNNNNIECAQKVIETETACDLRQAHIALVSYSVQLTACKLRNNSQSYIVDPTKTESRSYKNCCL